VLSSATDPTIPLFRTLDNGETWTAIEGIFDVTALAIDPEDPDFLVVGTFAKNREAARIQVSHDSGESWQTVLTIRPHRPGASEDPEDACRVQELVVASGKTRKVLVRTNQGVYLVRLTRSDLAH
jgi:hypothetical protein